MKYEPTNKQLGELQSAQALWLHAMYWRLLAECVQNQYSFLLFYSLLQAQSDQEGGESDTANRLHQIQAPAVSGGGVGVTTYLYDLNDNLISQEDAENKVTRFDYDALNRRTHIEYADGQRFNFDDYDANGNLMVATDPNGITMTYEYDALNRETLRTYSRPSPAIGIDIESVQTRYDGNNNVRSVTEHYYSTAINDRITAYEFDNFDRLQKQVDSFGQSTKFGYDLNGVRTNLTDADNKTTQYIPDELNRIAQVVNAQGTTQYDYFRDSQLKTVTYPNNIRSRYTYDTAGRVDTIINTQNSAVVSSYDYDYDHNGNRTAQIEINGGAAETTTYDFDDLDRLTGVTYPDQTVTYTYDLAYNRKTEIARSSDNTVTKHWQYQYNDRHQLTDILDQLDNANSITYSYDDNGNQTAKTKASEITAFVFDARDDMRKVQVGGSTVGQFLYDAAGLRIEKAGDRGIERYTYDDLSVLRQFDENNQTLAKFDYGPNRLLSLRHSTEGTQFYLMDALNSVVNLANASGAVQARYQYDAWGNKRNETGSSWNRFGFTGHEHDTESGLIYAKARFYDPETGRFLGQDAWEGDSQLPPSLHKYLYAYQNPTVFVDPDGNQTVYQQGSSFSDQPHEGQLGNATLEQVQEGIIQGQREVAKAGSPDCDNGCVEGNGDNSHDISNTTIASESAENSTPNTDLVDDSHKQRLLQKLKELDDDVKFVSGFHPAVAAYEDAQAIDQVVDFAKQNPGVSLTATVAAACAVSTRCRIAVKATGGKAWESVEKATRKDLKSTNRLNTNSGLADSEAGLNIGSVRHLGKPTAHEEMIGDELASAGNDVLLRGENTPGPDMILNGKYFDIKKLKGEGKETLENSVRSVRSNFEKHKIQGFGIASGDARGYIDARNNPVYDNAQKVREVLESLQRRGKLDGVQELVVMTSKGPINWRK